MKKLNFTMFSLCLGLVALAGLVSCNKPAAHSADDGHGHGAAAHGEAKAHVQIKDGVEMCTEHGVPEEACAVCKPELAGKLKEGDSLKLRLPSLASAEIVGVTTSAPTSGAVDESVECMAELAYNQNRLAQITTPVGGIIHSVEVDLGSRVEEGQTLAGIWSSSVSELMARAVLTHQTLDRERRLRSERVSSEQSLQEAEATHRSVCQQARSLGFSEEQIDALGRDAEAQVYLNLRAPFAGEVVERTAVRGASVEAGRSLFTVADRSVMWAWIQVPESLLSRVRQGQPVELRSDSLPGKVFLGKLTWLSPAVDEHTRMVRARAEFSNEEGLLRDRMFASARILTRHSTDSLSVPSGAVQHIDGKPFVFVRLEADLFDARAVRLGVRSNGRQELLGGVSAGEQIAVDHSFAIKSAMMMARMGAGCADD